METYKQFLDRINSFEKREIIFGRPHFMPNAKLSQKVNGDNTFKSFYGDTVVFSLDESVKRKLAQYVYLLYKVAPQCFCERLNPNTFHITLHDLSNSPNLAAVEEEMARNETKIRKLSKSDTSNINLKSKYVFNMVDMSLVLGLYPAEEEDFLRLMQLYSVFDEVQKLSYPLTPHITLAYYNVNGFDSHPAQILTDAVNKLNNEINFEFTAKDLYYQKFTSMNYYTDIIKLN